MTIAADFAARFPGFDTAISDTYLPVVEPIYTEYFGGDYDNAKDKEIILNLIAHLMLSESSSSTASSAVISSSSVDGLSFSYKTDSVKTQTDEFFGSTKYGKRFLLLTSAIVSAISI